MKNIYEVRWRSDNNPFETLGEQKFAITAHDYVVIRNKEGEFDSLVFRDEWTNPIKELFTRPANVERMRTVGPDEEDTVS